MADISRWNGTSGYPILKLNEAKEVTAAAQTTAAFKIELTGGDYKTAILIANAGSSSANAVFSIGNGIQGAGSPLTVAVGAGKTVAIVLDSGYFKNVSGTAKDCVTVTCSAALSFTVFELPQ